MPVRPPTFCVGCPERPVLSAMKFVGQDIGRPHVSMDVGCHAFASFEPFSQGNTLLGYGMSLASAAGVGPMSAKRPVSIMGDGGFWHNGLLSGVASNLLNKGDGVLVIMKNGYASATGTQELISSPSDEAREASHGASSVHDDRTIEDTLTGLGVKWLRTVNNYDVAEMSRTYREAMTTPEKGLKVIVAEGECQLERQRRLKPEAAQKLAKGERQVRGKYGVDAGTCPGDHSCIRLSGWLMEAATESDLPAQATSIPGVAQRTGATTYYLEIYPARKGELGGREPVLSLTPSPGNVDIMVASELVEAGRAMQNGYVNPERTTLIASTHRIYATVEKMQMADGRYDSDKVLAAGQQLAKKAVLFDMRKLAQESGTVINAVLFGAMAGSGVLPLRREACEAAIRKGGRC